MRSRTTLFVIAMAVTGCGGSTSNSGTSTGGSVGTGGMTSLPDGGSIGGNSAGGNSAGSSGIGTNGGSGGTATTPPDAGVTALMPEMPPTKVDNPSHSRLIQLYVGYTVFALFEDGSLYHWDYYINDQLAMHQNLVMTFTGLKGAVQIDGSYALAENGTIGYWNYGPNYTDLVVQQIPGVARGLFISDGCALIADGSVRCWSEPSFVIEQHEPPTYVATAMGVPSSVELDSNFYSRCILLRDRSGKVTRFEPSAVDNQLQAISVSEFDIGAPAERLFQNCAIPTSGSPRCLWGGQMGDIASKKTCAQAVPYDVAISGTDRLVAASLGGDLRGSALGESGKVYATITRPDPTSKTIHMDPVSGIDHAVFVTSGLYVSCAVDPPQIKCWGHEGTNAFQPMPIKFGI